MEKPERHIKVTIQLEKPGVIEELIEDDPDPLMVPFRLDLETVYNYYAGYQFHDAKTIGQATNIIFTDGVLNKIYMPFKEFDRIYLNYINNKNLFEGLMN